MFGSINQALIVDKGNLTYIFFLRPWKGNHLASVASKIFLATVRHCTIAYRRPYIWIIPLRVHVWRLKCQDIASRWSDIDIRPVINPALIICSRENFLRSVHSKNTANQQTHLWDIFHLFYGRLPFLEWIRGFGLSMKILPYPRKSQPHYNRRELHPHEMFLFFPLASQGRSTVTVVRGYLRYMVAEVPECHQW